MANARFSKTLAHAERSALQNRLEKQEAKLTAAQTQLANLQRTAGAEETTRNILSEIEARREFDFKSGENMV